MSYYSNYDQLSEEEFSTLQNDELADIEIADSELEWRYVSNWLDSEVRDGIIVEL